MGTMIFNLPADLPGDALEELERASVLGGQDNMPYATQVQVDPGQMVLQRQVDESGALATPWDVNGAGRLMMSSGCLMERPKPYQLPVELARGKINQVRCQTSDWVMGGLLLSDEFAGKMRKATRALGQAVVDVNNPGAIDCAQEALKLGCQAADQLVQAYIKQVFAIRHQRQPRLDTALACRVEEMPGAAQHAALSTGFNSLGLALSWRHIEPEEGRFDWQAADALVNWAAGLKMPLVGGPLIDFSGYGMPDWLWEKENDLMSLASLLGDFVENVVHRYQDAIRTWQVTAGSNTSGVLAQADEELLWLTVRLAEAVRRVDPTLETIVGIAQPLGDYLAQQQRTQSPFGFADTLIRTGLKLAALDLELVMGVWPRGTYCRDLLDVSRMLDLYALLGLPLQTTIAYPAAAGRDDRADPDQKASAGHWQVGFSPAAQADWTAAFASLCLCKPYVRTVQWAQFSDQLRHQFPHCGLVDQAGNPRPALERLRNLRGVHLK